MTGERGGLKFHQSIVGVTDPLGQAEYRESQHEPNHTHTINCHPSGIGVSVGGADRVIESGEPGLPGPPDPEIDPGQDARDPQAQYPVVAKPQDPFPIEHNPGRDC